MMLLLIGVLMMCAWNRPQGPLLTLTGLWLAACSSVATDPGQNDAAVVISDARADAAPRDAAPLDANDDTTGGPVFTQPQRLVGIGCDVRVMVDEDTAPLALVALQIRGIPARFPTFRAGTATLGHKIVLADSAKEVGIEPPPERGNKMPWKTFLKAHWHATVATDFFTVEALTLFGLVRYQVLFAIELSTRRAESAWRGL